MAELTTIARPYAQAVFGLARDTKRFAEWSDMLAFIASVYADPQVQRALANPKLTKEDVERLLVGVCGERLDLAARNLLILLVRNDRLTVLPYILERYEQMREEQENTLEASVESAFPLNDEQLEILMQRLERRTNHKVKANVRIAPELIGGVKVQIGDEVWDASVRGQIDGMAGALIS
jgi:F-type H+-transporting ATPase subunit delta